jgi:hypothetical protein
MSGMQRKWVRGGLEAGLGVEENWEADFDGDGFEVEVVGASDAGVEEGFDARMSEAVGSQKSLGTFPFLRAMVVIEW